MNNEVMIAVGALGVMSVLLYVLFRGVPCSLSTAQPGEIFTFDYEQPYHGETKRILAKVVEPVYTLDDLSIKNLNRRSTYRRNDPVFHRTRHLVTCQMPNGEVRNFYAERTKNVRRTVMFGNVFHKTAALLF